MTTYVSDEVKKEVKDLLEELEDMKDELEQIAGRLEQAEQCYFKIPDELKPTMERLRQVRAAIETATSDNNEWLGGNMFTLDKVIDEVLEFKHEMLEME